MMMNMDDNVDDMHDAHDFYTPSSSDNAPFTIDEGFAEDSQTQMDSHGAAFTATAAHFQQWIQAQRPEIRAEVAYEILRTLRTSQISTIVDKLMPLLHMDPIEKLPAEVTLMIFSHLDAATLLTASLASHTWRERILDPRLWQDLYRSEGWRIDAQAVKDFETEHAGVVRSEFKKAKSLMRHSLNKGQPLSKRRATSDWLDSKQRQVSADVAHWREQHGVVEADVDATDGGDHEMHDVNSAALESPPRPNKRQSQDSGDDMDYSHESDPDKTRDAALSSVIDLLVEDPQGHVKLNWPYIYRQRYKLEENWLQGKYVNFQLPHPNYPHEAHTECVYTIQFQGKWLVSGSRDKTLRIWDLETRRLRGKPLTGHSQSVLCLQFDPSEDEDVIISGSSDSSVIVWKFSTGQKLHVIPSAHEESVLNLKFDKRYLVTCSKDKKIKIWNRNQLTPLDPDYPSFKEARQNMQSVVRFPSYIVDVSTIEPFLLESRLASGQIKSLQPYMHLMTLEGHVAAVNAIQISGDMIVSASGDRLIRVWSIKNGTCLRVLPGHQKGIACVQFDNKRIVSGSSDHTVRVYDLVSGVELAVLLGHQNLVRTVQAGFGDAPGSEEEYLALAKEAEQSCYGDLESGNSSIDRQVLRRIRNGEHGSSRIGVGSSLPPGGGGSKWARIVSGSYDESIIVWKKDAKGAWIPGLTLRQDAAVRASIDSHGRQPNRNAELAARGSRADLRQRRQVTGNGNAGRHGAAVTASHIVQQAMNVSLAGLQAGIQNAITISRGLHGDSDRAGDDDAASGSNVTPEIAAPIVHQTANRAIHSSQVAASTVISNAISRHISSHVSVSYNSAAPSTSSQHVNVSTVTSNSGAPFNRSVTTVSNTSAAPSSSRADTAQEQQQASQDAQPSTPATQVQTTPLQPPASLQAHTQVHPRLLPLSQPQQQLLTPVQPLPSSNPSVNPNPHAARVFKLQFDARRVVCCSQDSRIIGWDFANGDPEVEAACRFFVGP